MLFSRSREENEILEKDPDIFFKTCLEVSNEHVSCKKKFTRCNNKPLLTIELSKAFMQRSRLRNKFLSE